MTLPVTDVRSNPQDQIAHAAKVLGRSKDRIKVFLELHRGKQRTKTATEIAQATGLKRKRVLEEAKKLEHKQIIKLTRRNGEVAYERDGFYYAQRDQIVALASNPTKLKAFPTKYSPRGSVQTIVLKVPRPLVKTVQLTVNDIDSFAKVRRANGPSGTRPLAEAVFKRGVQGILGEGGRFRDWGGETSDLYTNRVRMKGRRVAAAFAFKGRATRGVLTPARMGRNGDQIQRLFVEDAVVFIIQYAGQIAPSILQQMAVFAQAKSLSTGTKIYYGVIDGDDSRKLQAAYPAKFR